MPQYKLVYFGARGRGEPLRYIFAYAKVPYENHVVDFQADWPTLKPQCPFGHIPVLYVDGKPLSQFAAIGSFLAREFGIDGKTNFERGRADMLVQGVNEAISNGYPEIVMAIMSGGDAAKVKEAWQSFKEKSAVPFLKRYTGFLKENKSGWLVGESLTYADLEVAEFVDRFDTCFEPGILNEYPELKALRDKVHKLEGVAKYVAERPKLPC